MSVEDFWKEEEKKDKKFMKEFEKDLDEFIDKEELVCNEKCIHNIGNTCSISDWNCRTKLDRKEMKFN